VLPAGAQVVVIGDTLPRLHRIDPPRLRRQAGYIAAPLQSRADEELSLKYCHAGDSEPARDILGRPIWRVDHGAEQGPLLAAFVAVDLRPGQYARVELAVVHGQLVNLVDLVLVRGDTHLTTI